MLWYGSLTISSCGTFCLCDDICLPGLGLWVDGDHIAIYKGTVNDPTTFPLPNKSEGSYHWAFERLLAASLVPITGAAFVTSGSAYPVLDGLLGVSLVMHSHIGVCLSSSTSAALELTKSAFFSHRRIRYFPRFRRPFGNHCGISLTTSWWTTYIHASSQNSVRLSLGF